MAVSNDTLAIQLAELTVAVQRVADTQEAQAADIKALLARTAQAPVTVEPTPVSKDIADPETEWWPRPTLDEYLAGSALPRVTNPSDTFAVYRLARVGRLANGELRSNWSELQAGYDFIAKLASNEVRIFVEAVEHPSSPGAQQAIVLTKINGFEVAPADFPVGFGVRYEWWGLADCAKAAIGDRIAGQG